MKNYRKLIKEVLVLDTLSNLSKEQKLGIKFLHREYGNVNYEHDLNVDKMTDDLEEMLGFDYKSSRMLANFYKKNRTYLFKDMDEEYLDTVESDLLYGALKKYLTNVSKSDLEEYINEGIKKSKLNDISNLYVGVSYFLDTLTIIVFNEKTMFSNKTQRCIFNYNLEKLKDMEGKVTHIPFILTIKGIENDFIPTYLENTKYEVNLPINFEIKNINKKNILDLILGKENSIISDFVDRMYDILSENK